MTPKQILDSFSETLMRDERIFSAQERALVATLLQHAKAATAANPETQEAVNAVIASAVGETVAQRAFTVLGGSIVERILESNPLPLRDAAGKTADIYAGPVPNEPDPPGVRAPTKPHDPRRWRPTRRGRKSRIRRDSTASHSAQRSAAAAKPEGTGSAGS